MIGVFTYLLNYLNPRFSDRTFVSQFIRYFWLVLIVPAILLMISLFRRISDYGVTEERYALALIASWLVLVILLYGILRWRALKWLPISLSVVVAFGLLSGPLSIFGATLSSQEQRLHEMMTQAGLLGEGAPDVDHKHTEILDQLRYLDDRSDLSFINDWIEVPIVFKDESIKLDTSNAQLVAQLFDLKEGYYNSKDRQYFSIRSEGDYSDSIEDYRYLISFDVHFNDISQPNPYAYINDRQLYVNYDNANYQISLHDSIEIWQQDDHRSDQLYQLPVSLGENSGDMYFKSIEGEQFGMDSIRIDYTNGILLIR